MPISKLLSVLLCLFLVAGCSSQKAVSHSSELPPKHWLDDAPGIPVENKERLESAIPNLYEPNKAFSFDECVFLTVQQSPVLVNSAVEIEIKRLALTNAEWQYVPVPRLTFSISANLTRYNENEPNLPADYGQPVMKPKLYFDLVNPVATYFEQQIQHILLNMAISSHRKVVGQVICQIAGAYLRLQAQQDMVNAQKELLPLSEEKIKYWEKVEEIDGRQGAFMELAKQEEKASRLMIEKTSMQEAMALSQLKAMAGIKAYQDFKVNMDSVNSILAGFDGEKLDWEKQWTETEDEMLLRTQIKLAEYGIRVAWAQYIPGITLDINTYPPAGQYQPPGGTEDYFVHLNFSIPLLDYGRRYRGVQTARMQKAQAYQALDRSKKEYGNKWLKAKQEVEIAKTELDLKKNQFDTAEMQFREAKISFEQGLSPWPVENKIQQKMLQARLGLIQAELEYKLALLNWMEVANVLQERFLGPPSEAVDD